MDTSESSLLPAANPRTGTVLLWLSAAALVVSYLAAYAFVNALVAAEVLARWPSGRDPRPRLMLTIFCTFTSAGVIAVAVTRCLSRKHLQSLKSMEETEEGDDRLLRIMKPSMTGDKAPTSKPE